MSIDLKQITLALERLFHEEGQPIVFWNDPDGVRGGKEEDPTRMYE